MTTDDTDNRAHPNDWDTQRERLSAYLDDQLAANERAALERHLPTCARCAAELVELRRTVALLRALPTPALPRSFALPVPDAAPAPAPVAAAATRAAPRSAPTSRRVPRWPGLAQWAGGLAAAAGIVLVLGSALAGGLPAPQFGSAAMTTSSNHNAAAPGPYGGTNQGTASTASPARVGPESPATAPPSASGSTCATAAPTTPTTPGSPCVSIQGTTQQGATPTLAPATPTSARGHFGADTSNGSEPAPPALPIAGGGLAVAGLVVFALGRRARRH